MQSQIEDLGRRSDSEFVAFLDSDLNVVAHTDRRRIGQQEKEPLILKAKIDRQLFSSGRRDSGGKRYLEVVKPVTLDESNLGFLKIGFRLDRWRSPGATACAPSSFSVWRSWARAFSAWRRFFITSKLTFAQVKALEAEVSASRASFGAGKHGRDCRPRSQKSAQYHFDRTAASQPGISADRRPGADYSS